jgi:ketosteroid isomerase-like protein
MAHETHAIQLTREASRHPEVFAEAFNSGRPELVEQVYEDDAIFVTREGRVVTGPDRARANAEIQGLGVPIEIAVRHVFEQGDIALLVVDWAIRADLPAGGRIDVTGTATDVARRGRDGCWRYLIDNPFGIQVGAT